MFRKIILSVFAIALIGSVGCDWPWTREPESNSETHAKFLAATKELTRLRIEAANARTLAICHLSKNDEDQFSTTVEFLKANLEAQREQCNQAEANAASLALRRNIRTERENIETAIKNFDSSVTNIRVTREWGDWLKTTTN